MNRRISIVVKGDLRQAANEAVARGVYCTKAEQTQTRLRNDTGTFDDTGTFVGITTLWSDERYETEIARWFADTPDLIPGYGFPAGTCLIYSVHDHTNVNMGTIHDRNWRDDQV